MVTTKIPITLKPYFQEHIFENLDPDQDEFLVIERTLAWGESPELRWLFAYYGSQRLATWVQRAGWQCLPRRRFKYWQAFFKLHKSTMRERIWPH